MKFTRFFLLLISIGTIQFVCTGTGWTCTTFVIQHENESVFGRNFDWYFDDAMIVVNKRGCIKRSAVQAEETGPGITWKSVYGSITFNQYGREFPMGGSQFRQYLLDTCRTVQDIIEADKKVRISDKAQGPGIHLLVTDKNGQSAVLEFLNGQLKSYTGDSLPLPVLTNSTYGDSIKWFKKNKVPVMDPFNSIKRFITASQMIQSESEPSSKDIVAYAFNILEAVSSGRTQWRIVYDNRNMIVHLQTKMNRNLRYFKLAAFDFSMKTPVKILDINAGSSENVADEFTAYSYGANRYLIGRAFKKSRFLSRVPDERMDLIAGFPEQFECSD